MTDINRQTDQPLTPVDRLLTIMTMLRDSEFGCPWDLEQSTTSLIPFTIEEVYEVVDAIERNDQVDLEDELGDLLFQVVFYAQMAKEDSKFDFDDVANTISDKLLRRHPHVFPGGKLENFGNKQALSSDEVLVNWEAIKQQEREEKRIKRGGEPQAQAASVLDDVPRALPALERARKLQKRAASNGFDWQNVPPVIAKLKEEIAELENALADQDANAVRHELGDVMFSVVNLARHIKEDPEVALRDANNRFERRFNWIESALAERGESLQEVTLDELESLWGQAKQSGL